MTIQESWWRDILRLIVWYPFRLFCQIAPMWINYRLFVLMGYIHFFLSRQRRANLTSAIQKTLAPFNPTNKPCAYVLDFFVNHYVDRLSIFHYHRLTGNTLSNVVSFEGLELLDQVLERGKGCVLVHGHVGPSQLSLVALSQKGYAMTQLGFRTAEGLSAIGKHVQLRNRLKIEEKFNAEMLYVDKFQRKVFRSLAANRVVMTAGDGSGREKLFGHHQECTFLNFSHHFSCGPFRLAQKTGAGLLYLCLIRQSLSHYRVVIRQPENLLVDEAEIPENIQEYARHFESCVLRAPGQWHFWEQFVKFNKLGHF